MFCDHDCYASAESDDLGIGPITRRQARAKSEVDLGPAAGLRSAWAVELTFEDQVGVDAARVRLPPLPR